MFLPRGPSFLTCLLAYTHCLHNHCSESEKEKQYNTLLQKNTKKMGVNYNNHATANAILECQSM